MVTETSSKMPSPARERPRRKKTPPTQEAVHKHREKLTEETQRWQEGMRNRKQVAGSQQLVGWGGGVTVVGGVAVRETSRDRAYRPESGWCRSW
jgi:hypothetical protein